MKSIYSEYIYNSGENTRDYINNEGITESSYKLSKFITNSLNFSSL